MTQHKLIDDLIDLEIHTEKISEASMKVRVILDTLLSAQNKAFEVIFDGNVFDFYYPTTTEEGIELSAKRKQLIDLVLFEAFKTGNWDYVLAFASGLDPLEMQMEKIDLNTLYNITDSDGDIIKALPLNEDAHVVKVQRLKEDDVEKIEELV